MKTIHIRLTTKLRALLALPLALGAFAVSGATQAQAAPSASSTATLTMDNFAAVTASGNITLAPGQADFEANEIEQSSALTLNVTTNDASGCTISVRGAASPTLSNADLLIKSSTAGTASGFGSYAAAPTDSLPLWSTTGAQPNGTEVTLDVKVKNLRNYAGGSGGAGSTATYTNTLTFDVLPNS